MFRQAEGCQRQPQITDSARSLFFSLAVYLTYGVFYLAPAWLWARIGMQVSHRAWVHPQQLAAVLNELRRFTNR